MRLWHYLIFLALLLSTGCTRFNPAPPAPSVANIACQPALTELDELAGHHAGTLSDQRIAQTPWLRTNRFLHSFQQQPLNQTQLQTLLRRMNNRTVAGLTLEIGQIPASRLQHWQTTHRIQSPPAQFIRQCAQQLLARQLTTPQQTRGWLRQLSMTDSYSKLQRIAGLYPLAAIPFRWGVVREQKVLQQQWHDTTNTDTNDNRITYRPARSEKHAPALRRDALHIPVISAQDGEQLLAQYAPDWAIDSQSVANLPGTPRLSATRLSVDIRQHSSYAFISFGRWKNQITTQLNYLIWFSERPALHWFDWVAGQHDAVIFRVHLDAAQNILAYDSIHLCGCWYRLFLPTDTPYTANREAAKEPVLAERVDVAEQMQIHLSRDTHQIVALHPMDDSLPPAVIRHYKLRPYSELLRIPVFDQQGYVPGSERPERWLFWPMGVRNPGALRRFGEHAISFIGKRHFDDPYLLEEVGVK